MPTNTEIMQQISALERRMDSYEDRLKHQEVIATENTNMLREVKGATDFLRSSFRALRWAGMAICAAALWQVGALLFHLIFH